MKKPVNPANVTVSGAPYFVTGIAQCENSDSNHHRPHERGSNPGGCHDCAMQYDENYNLIPLPESK